MQATREDCPPAQLLQLLLPKMYPEDAASELAAEARAKEQLAKEQRAMMQRNWIIGGAVGAAVLCVIVLWKRR
jgi:hypothetical protein